MKYRPTLTLSSSEVSILNYSNLKYFQSSSSSGPMGCGSSYEPSQPCSQSAAVHCDLCGKSFSFISRKRTCPDCSNIFCCTCLPTKGGRCSRCGVLNQKPPHRGELMKLRVKDLQHFLTRKRINIKSCVGESSPDLVTDTTVSVYCSFLSSGKH